MGFWIRILAERFSVWAGGETGKKRRRVSPSDKGYLARIRDNTYITLNPPSGIRRGWKLEPCAPIYQSIRAR